MSKIENEKMLNFNIIGPDLNKLSKVSFRLGITFDNVKILRVLIALIN